MYKNRVKVQQGRNKEEKGRRRRHCVAGSYRQFRPGSWFAEKMYVCSHLFLTVVSESGFRAFRMLTRKVSSTVQP